MYISQHKYLIIDELFQVWASFYFVSMNSALLSSYFGIWINLDIAIHGLDLIASYHATDAIRKVMFKYPNQETAEFTYKSTILFVTQYLKSFLVLIW